MSKIPLASGHITAADVIVVELVAPHETPATVMINWPPEPTVCEPRRLTEVATAAMRILAGASTELARIKAARRL